MLSALGESPSHQHPLRRGAVALRLLQPLDNLFPNPGHSEKLFRPDFFQIVNLLDQEIRVWAQSRGELVTQSHVNTAGLKGTWTHQGTLESIFVGAVHGATALNEAQHVEVQCCDVAHGQVGDDRLLVPTIGLYDYARREREVVMAVHNPCNQKSTFNFVKKR